VILYVLVAVCLRPVGERLAEQQGRAAVALDQRWFAALGVHPSQQRTAAIPIRPVQDGFIESAGYLTTCPRTGSRTGTENELTPVR
jgi:hypothetical protein